MQKKQNAFNKRHKKNTFKISFTTCLFLNEETHNQIETRDTIIRLVFNQSFTLLYIYIYIYIYIFLEVTIESWS